MTVQRRGVRHPADLPRFSSGASPSGSLRGARGVTGLDLAEGAAEATWAQRVEHEDVLAGRALYTADVDRPGMVWARIVRSPVAAGAITAIDSAAALEMPGVLGVFTAEDLDSIPRIELRERRGDPPPERLARWAQPVLASGQVRFVGEPVAVVVAENPYTAEDAADLVEVQVSEGTPVVAAHDEPSPWADGEDNVLFELASTAGAVDAAFASADVVVSGEFEVARQTGLAMETRGLVAEWTAQGQLHLWGPAKYVEATCRFLARCFELSLDDVVVHHVRVGGGFGSRGEFYPEDFLIPWVARLVGRPVKWVEDRREHLIAINHARGARYRLELAASAERGLLGYRGAVTIDHGAYPRPIGIRLLELALGALPGPYRWQGYHATCEWRGSNKTPIGTMRGPATFDATFARERLIDMAADKLGVDRADFRARCLLTAEELPYEVTHGSAVPVSRYDSGDYPQMFAELLERGDWRGMLDRTAERRRAGEMVGVGCGLYVDHSGLGPRKETVTLHVDGSGELVVGTTASELGQGITTAMQQVLRQVPLLADLPLRVVTNDSRATRGGGGTSASRSTIFVGSALLDAVERLREQVAHELDERGVAAGELRLDGSGARRGSDLVKWVDLALPPVEGHFGVNHGTYGLGVALAQVRVDPISLQPAVERAIVGYDCARALDPSAVRSQLVGAAVQGLGGALFEALEHDPVSGEPQTTTLADYRVPISTDVPDIEAHVFELGGVTSNPLGIKGAGEAGLMGMGAALANAVADATGRQDVARRLPLHPADLDRTLEGSLGRESALAASAVGSRSGDEPVEIARSGAHLPTFVLGFTVGIGVAIGWERRRRGA